MYIRDEQDLLERYFLSEKGIIGEFSGDIARDDRELSLGIENYAQRKGLNAEFAEFDPWLYGVEDE